MQVVEDLESRPHKEVVEREKEIQDWNGQKLPKVFRGGEHRGEGRKVRKYQVDFAKDCWAKRHAMQIGNEEVEEDEVWQKGDQTEEGRGSLKADVMQKVPELVVHERTAQGEKVTGANEKRRLPGPL